MLAYIYIFLVLNVVQGFAPPARTISDVCLVRTFSLYPGKLSQHEQVFENLREKPLPVNIDECEELRLLHQTDISRSDNFWKTTSPKLKKQRQAAKFSKDAQKWVAQDDQYNKLMNIGFERRRQVETAIALEEPYEANLLSHAPAAMLRKAAMVTSNYFELGKSKEEQLKDARRRKLRQRNAFIQVLPPVCHKYIDYAISLRKLPNTVSETIRNLGVASAFAGVILLNSRARMAFIYAVIGNAAIMSILLTRNMPKKSTPLGLDPKKVISWSQSSFRTAVGITVMYALSSALAIGITLSLARLNLSLALILRISMAISVLSAAYFTSFYEVFEEKNKPGWRWKKALGRNSIDDVTKIYSDELLGHNALNCEDGISANTDKYDFEYDPEIDENPRQPKYLDEVTEGAASPTAITSNGGSGQIDELESEEHFNKWYEARRSARIPPIMDANPEDEWVGGKAGMYVQSPPKWLASAYKKNVLRANRWRDAPTNYRNQTSETEPIHGPVGFRDKRPDWLTAFGGCIWEDKVTVSRSAARAFGTYRKTMWKIDKDVVVQPCDGANA